MLRDITFRIGEAPVRASTLTIKQFDSTILNWQDSLEIIGTLGADLIDGHVAIINYPKQQITLTTSAPDSLQLSSFIFAQKRILLPAEVNGAATLLFFDSGSSMFELLTNRVTARQMAQPGAQATRYPANSWGRQLTANTIPASGSIRLGGQALR